MRNPVERLIEQASARPADARMLRADRLVVSLDPLRLEGRLRAIKAGEARQRFEEAHARKGQTLPDQRGE